MKLEDYFDTQLGIDIWEKKYQQNGETFDGWLDRVSGGNVEVRTLIENKQFMFGGRILANRGIDDRKITLSNCYVLPAPEDNLESIYDTAAKLARTFSYGGGVGIDLSKLAPRGTPINNAAKFTSGAVTFGELFNTTTEIIGQDGRRGALMLSLSCEHPDLEEFIDAKTKDGALSKANISVRMTDGFMEAARSGKPFTQSFTRNGETVEKIVDARALFDKLVTANHNWSEPGILFWDSIEGWHGCSEYDGFEFAGVNPCAEETLMAGGSCLLGSINLSEFVTDGALSIKAFDTVKFKETVTIAVRALNDVLDEGLYKHPLDIQIDTARDWRQIGLGVMGYADALVKMGLVYGSVEAIHFTNLMASTFANAAYFASAQMSRESGSFPMYDECSTISAGFFENNMSEQTYDAVETYGLRNSQILSIAPTGTISTMLGISGGIEPYFALKYTRKTQSLHGVDIYYDVNVPLLEEWISENPGKDVPAQFTTSADIAPHDRIKTQAAWQTYIDASISSTVNLQNDATEEQVWEIYMDAWTNDLKGITVHRSGNMREGVLTVGEPVKDDVEPSGTWKELSEDIVYHKRKIYTGCGKVTLFIGVSPTSERVEELYLKRSGKGGCERSLDALCVTMSGMLRLGGSIDNVEKALRGIGPCASFVRERAKGTKLSNGSNCASAILHTIKTFKSNEVVEGVVARTCPECSSNIVFEGGCSVCKNCGFSKCD